ncbi:shot (predicted), partial [Pycnogonum litorale]
FQPVYREVLDKEHEVHILLNRGKEMLSKLGRSNEATNLKVKLDNTRKQWDKIRKEATNRNNRLQGCLENCKRFHSALDNFTPWLEQAEHRLGSMQPISFKKKELDKQIKELQLFKNDVNKHSQEYESVKNLGETLMNCCDTDKDVVRDELNQLKRRWDELHAAIGERAHDLDDIGRRLGHYQDNVRDLQHSLGRCEDKFVAGSSGNDAKNLQRMKNLQEEVEGLKKQLDNVKDIAESLIADASPVTDTSHISKEVNDLEDRFNKLNKGVEGRCADLEAASQLVDEFKDQVKSVNYELTALEEELDNMSPIGRDLDTVNSQMDEIKIFIRKVEKAHEDVAELDRNCKEIIKQGYSSDARGLKDQIDYLRRQLGKIDDRAKHRERDIDAMLNKLDHFYDAYKDATKDLENAASEERAFRPVGADVDTVKAQQQEFKQFKREKMEPLGREIDQVNKTGQGLIQSAVSTVNTTELEGNLEYLNSQFNALKEKLRDRERKLDIALLQSGKFQDALNGLLKWLEETEEMVANQRQPSSDYNIVKAQLQEQKFLRRMLTDRESGIKSLIQIGAEVSANVDASEKANIDSQLDDIVKRFNRLDHGCRDRTELLERCLAVAKRYQGKVHPLVDWLDNTEKKLAAMDTIPTD